MTQATKYTKTDQPIKNMNRGIHDLAKCQFHHFHGLEFVLDPSGAVWIPSEQKLLVADLHLEKGSSLAQKGQLIPPYDTRATLQKLGAQIAYYQPKTIIALGDNFHDVNGMHRLSRADHALLTMLTNQATFIWIEGNHDNPDFYKTSHSRSDRVIDLWASQKNDSFMQEQYCVGDITCVHDAALTTQRPIVAGHLHPVAVLKHKSVSVRKRCFFAGKDVFILPSFGVYTGGLNIRHHVYDDFWCHETKAYLINNDQVFPAPTAQLVGSVRK